MIACLECGRVFRQITHAHLIKEHGITAKQYREKHPSAVMLSEESKRLKVEIYKNRDPEVEKRRREKIADYGKNRPEEIRQKILLNSMAGTARMTQQQKDLRKLRVEEAWKNKTEEERLENFSRISAGWKRQSKERKEEIRRNKSKAAKQAWDLQTPEQVVLRGKKIAAAWARKSPQQKEEILRKYAKSLSNRFVDGMNKGERLVLSLISHLGFRFVGDRKYFVIDDAGAMCPDFIRDSDGFIFELFGEYYHTPDEWPIRKSRLESKGHRAAMVWYGELMKDPSIVERRIKEVEDWSNNGMGDLQGRKAIPDSAIAAMVITPSQI